MDDENPSISPLLSGNEVLSRVIDRNGLKDKGIHHTGIIVTRAAEFSSDKPPGLLESCHR